MKAPPDLAAQWLDIAAASSAESGNLVERLTRTAWRHGWLERPAYVVEGRTFRFSEVYEGAARAAAAYSAHGLARGSRILLPLPDSIELVWAILGALHIGAIAVPVNADLHPAELRRAGEIAEPHAVVCPSGVAELFPFPRLSPAELREPDADVPPYAACTADTPAFAQFTSGTTSDPKLCVHTHGDPEVYDLGMGAAVGVTPEDICFSVSRMYFAYGLGNSLLFPLLRGATTVLAVERADAQAALTTIEKHGVTVFYAQPTFYALLLGHPGHEALDSLRLAVVAGEVLPEPLEERLRGVLGDRLLNVLGTTETGHVFLANGPDEVREFTVGKVVAPYRVRIVDDNDEEVAPGVEGSLQVAGPTTGLGIRRGGDAPVRLSVDEWYSTGDAATTDADGFVRVHGRLDDIEIVVGANVHPTEIEDLLMRHPAVREVAVCSVRYGDGRSGLRAFVVPGNGDDDTAAHERTSSELLATARTTLTWYKVPKDVVFVAELPRNATGKLLRRALRAMGEQDGRRP
jgi:fatty acid CoA ligase FadD22